MGRKLKIPTPEEMQKKWEEYKYDCDNNHYTPTASAGKVLKLEKRLVYSVVKFAVSIGITRETWRKYKGRARYTDTIKMIEEEVFASKEEALLNGFVPAVGIIFDMKVNYGLNERTLIDATVHGDYEVTLNLGEPGKAVPDNG